MSNLFFLLFSTSALAQVWLHREIRSIDKGTKGYSINQKLGTINKVASSSCGTTAASCLLNIPSDIAVGVPGKYSEVAPMYTSPIRGNTLNLAGDLVPTLNGANHSAYIAQLVFNGPCDSLNELIQINLVPIYETCTKFGTDSNGNSYFTLTSVSTASNGIPYAEDSYCSDSQCSDCIKTTTWNMDSKCVKFPNSELLGYYLPLVNASGLSVTGYNKTVPSASATVPAPAPTGVTSDFDPLDSSSKLSLLSLLGAAFFGGLF